jgi:hypothetical protein
VIASTLLAVFITFKIWELNLINLLSIIILIAIFLVLIFNIIPSKILIPYINKTEYDGYKGEKDIDGLHKQLIEEWSEPPGVDNKLSN